jgi:hypothetical protein
VAGTVAARHGSGNLTPLGVVDSASLVSCGFMTGASGYTSDAVLCIDWALSKGAAILQNRYA